MLFGSDNWSALLKSNLDAGYPIYYRGSGSDGAHAWVCDGYEGERFHMNWGWGWDSERMADSYWSLEDLSPSGKHFNSGQAILIPKPQGCTPFALLGGVQLNPIVEVNQWISASSTLPLLPGFSVVFNAHDEIVLTSGFTAAEGTDFHAFIEGCNGNFSPPASDDRSRPEEGTTRMAQVEKVTIAPNPFSAFTTVSYSLAGEQPVTMQLFSLTGQLLLTPLASQVQPAGPHEQLIDLAAFPAGIYLLVLKTGSQTSTQRLISM